MYKGWLTIPVEDIPEAIRLGIRFVGAYGDEDDFSVEMSSAVFDSIQDRWGHWAWGLSLSEEE